MKNMSLFVSGSGNTSLQKQIVAFNPTGTTVTNIVVGTPKPIATNQTITMVIIVCRLVHKICAFNGKTMAMYLKHRKEKVKSILKLRYIMSDCGIFNR